jgi:hydroxymethylglutaryl-CoA lyase
MRSDITIVEVAARDGLQNEANAAQLSAQQKVDFLAKLAASGLKRIEAGSFVHPQAVPAMANSDEVAALLSPVQANYPDVSFSYLVPNEKGLARAQALGVKEVAIFLALSDAFSTANIRQTVDASFAAITGTIQAATRAGMKVRGYISNVFGYTDYAFTPDDVAKRSQELLDKGCFEVSLGDTTALGTPEMIPPLLASLAQHRVPLENIAMHFHDTSGRAIENVAASYAGGIRVFDASTGGLGGCPYANSPKGNLAMESLLDWCAREGIASPVTNRAPLEAAATEMRRLLGKG